MSTTLRTGPLPRTGSTRSSPLSGTRAISEPKIAVAPPAGAVMTVTVFAFMASRFGSVHASSGLGMPSGRADCIEVKIVQKAMIRQIDRVINDLKSQVQHFKANTNSLITIGIVGVNRA